MWKINSFKKWLNTYIHKLISYIKYVSSAFIYILSQRIYFLFVSNIKIITKKFTKNLENVCASVTNKNADKYCKFKGGDQWWLTQKCEPIIRILHTFSTTRNGLFWKGLKVATRFSCQDHESSRIWYNLLSQDLRPKRKNKSVSG